MFYVSIGNNYKMKSQIVLIAFMALATGAGVAVSQPVFAQPGTELGPIITPDCSGSVGVAFDGNRIIYNCSDRTTLHFTNLAGTSLGSLAVSDALGAPVVADALSWDPTENKLWSGRQTGGVCTISSIDMTTGMATDRFSYSSSIGCTDTFYDGLTVDPVSNTIWTSSDNFATISHFTKTGTPLGSIDFGSLSAAFDGCSSPHVGGTVGCGNSGLAIGLDGTLFAGTNGVGKIYELKPSVPSITGVFASVSGRDEDLECGPQFTKSDGTKVETILSRDLLSANINLLEAPTGTCKSPAVHATPVGGEILPIDMTSLFVAGAMTNAFWILPTVGGIAGASFALFKVKRKSS
jgi:hypothetical protein